MKQPENSVRKGVHMILAEKIMSLRKQKGWSQEDLANELDVSRQSVSKWESASSIPDIQKIMKMSEIFDVSIDYLLKDELEDIEENANHPENKHHFHINDDGLASRNISLEEATEYIDIKKKMAAYIGFAISLFIIAPAVFIAMGNFSGIFNPDDSNGNGIIDVGMSNSNKAMAVGGIVLFFILIASGVFIMVLTSAKMSKFNFLDSESFKLAYGVEAAIKRKREPFLENSGVRIALGIAFCILSAIPILISGILFEDSDDISIKAVSMTLALVAIGVNILVKHGVIKAGYEKILQEGDFTKENKLLEKRLSWFPGVYWLSVIAMYLGYSLITRRWDNSWIIWPISGVLFAILYELLKLDARKKFGNNK